MTERTLTQVQRPERGFLRRLHDVTQVRQGRRQRGVPHLKYVPPVLCLAPGCCIYPIFYLKSMPPLCLLASLLRIPGDGSDRRTEIRWRQETSLAPLCSNLRLFGSKCTVLKKNLRHGLAFGAHQ